MTEPAFQAAGAGCIASLAAIGAAEAQSVGWDVFVARCLDPMTQHAPPDASGLAEGGADLVSEVLGLGPEAVVSYLADDGLILGVIDNNDGELPGCVVIDLSADLDVTRDTFGDWSDTELSEGRLRQTQSLLGDFYESRTGRSPSLRIGILTGQEPGSDQSVVALSVVENPT